MKTIYVTALLLMGACLYSQAQPSALLANQRAAVSADKQIGVHISYNAEQAQYEVYATANFSQARFNLGPSQVTVVVPRAVANQSLNVLSGASRWTDYSSVYAPTAAPDVDFHGVNSTGRVIDFQKDTPLLLFAFRLSEGYVDGVRLFINGRDPKSAQPGMMGGDFSNTLQDHRGSDYFRVGIDATQLAAMAVEEARPGEAGLTVFPNPVTGDSFAITATQYAKDERVQLRLLSATGVELLRLDETADKLVNYPVRVPKHLIGQAFLRAESLSDPQKQKSTCRKLVFIR